MKHGICVAILFVQARACDSAGAQSSCCTKRSAAHPGQDAEQHQPEGPSCLLQVNTQHSQIQTQLPDDPAVEVGAGHAPAQLDFSPGSDSKVMTKDPHASALSVAKASNGSMGFLRSARHSVRDALLSWSAELAVIADPAIKSLRKIAGSPYELWCTEESIGGGRQCILGLTNLAWASLATVVAFLTCLCCATLLLHITRPEHVVAFQAFEEALRARSPRSRPRQDALGFECCGAERRPPEPVVSFVG